MTTSSPAAAAAPPPPPPPQVVEEDDWSNLASATTDAAYTKEQNEEQDWHVTFAIWHMLPWMERKAMATHHGCKSIGEFEEYMSMRRAMMDEHEKNRNGRAAAKVTSRQQQQSPHPNKEDSYMGLRRKTKLEKKVQEDDVTPAGSDENDEDDELLLENSLASMTLQQQEHEKDIDDTIAARGNTADAASDDTDVDDCIQRGGLILTLPDELGHNIFSFLPVGQFAALALVSPFWKHLTRTEMVYRHLCERIYLHQSQKKTIAMHPTRNKFGGSYRTMLRHRPRVKTAGGLYVMKFAKVKTIQRDMWCEIPVGAILETVYYRYLYFCEQQHGKVLYALTTAAPHDIIRRVVRVLLSSPGDTTTKADKAICQGTYTVKGPHVTVTAQQEWQHVQLSLSILPESHWGRFGALSLDRHLTSTEGNFDEYAWPNDITEFSVPTTGGLQVFAHVPDRRL